LNRVSRLLDTPPLALVSAARRPLEATLLAGAVTAAVTHGALGGVDSDLVVLVVSAIVFTGIYAAMVLPRLRTDLPTVMEVTVDRFNLPFSRR
jgi:hypothetical protein